MIQTISLTLGSAEIGDNEDSKQIHIQMNNITICVSQGLGQTPCQIYQPITHQKKVKLKIISMGLSPFSGSQRPHKKDFGKHF